MFGSPKSTKNSYIGDMLKWRFDIINLLIDRCNAKKYLEIGVEDGDNINAIKCDLKHGVDPASRNATHHQTSDEFFDMLRSDYKYNVVFVDGLHVADQAERDIVNALDHLHADGYIVVHDCNPPTAWHQRSHDEARKTGFRKWNGDVYKAIVKLRATRNDIDVVVVDTDWGCGVIRKVAPDNARLLSNAKTNIEDIDYEWFAADRHRLLNLCAPDVFIDWLDNGDFASRKTD